MAIMVSTTACTHKLNDDEFLMELTTLELAKLNTKMVLSCSNPNFALEHGRQQSMVFGKNVTLEPTPTSFGITDTQKSLYIS